MMHHPNMHHQAMSGHPPQHMPGHQGMPGHHQMPPHQMHRDNRHVTLTRVPLGPSGGGGLGAHGQALGLGAVAVHHGPAQRAPHPVRPMPHHPPAQHHNVPQQMKQMRRPYGMGGGYGPGGGPGVMPPPYAQPQPRHPQPHAQPPHTVVQSQLSNTATNVTPSSGEIPSNDKPVIIPVVNPAGPVVDKADVERAAPGDSEAARPAPAQANSKEKTPMCLVNELARYNKIKHQYRLTSEMGPAHKKVFTVTLRLGDTEEYTSEGSSIKRAQHAAAHAALAATSFPPPPPRAPQPHAAPHAHHRHSDAVMPTVELNALAMKLCQPAVYTSIPAVACRGRGRAFRLGVGVGGPLGVGGVGVGMGGPLGGSLLYRVRVAVGGRAWLGEGGTPQAARHDAAARALHDLRPPPPPPAAPHTPDSDTGEANGDILNSEVKSPVSLVHELALKRNLSVQFTVKSERGPPHMRVFVTACTVGDIETEGEGNGKKVSKRRAAECMLEEMRRRWPPALLRPRPHHDKRRHQPTKKKPRNLIKEGGVAGAAAAGGGDNPISRLAVARHAVRARSPQYRVLEERGQARRREFLVQCDAPPHLATGLGPNKKTAKRRAAHNVLLAMEMSTNPTEAAAAAAVNSGLEPVALSPDGAKSINGDTKRKEGDVPAGGAAGAEVRQPVPGVLMMDYHQRSGQPPAHNGVSETSATGGGGGNTPGAKDQLMYLSQLLGFTVQFSDFPKRNHGEYLSLVSLSTEPPVMCHGGGPSTAHSHEQCSRAALRALALMGLDAPPPAPAPAPAPSAAAPATAPAAAPAPALSGAVGAAGALSNGIAE